MPGRRPGPVHDGEEAPRQARRPVPVAAGAEGAAPGEGVAHEVAGGVEAAPHAAADLGHTALRDTPGELARGLWGEARWAWAGGASRLRAVSRPVPATAAARLALSLASLSSLLIGVVAYAIGADGVRLAFLMFFCLVGVGSAPWQAHTGLRLPARLTLTMLTSLTVLTLGGGTMLAVGRWAPALAFAAVAAVAAPLQLLGVRLALRDVPGRLRPGSDGEAPSVDTTGAALAVGRWPGGWAPVAVAVAGAALCLGDALAHRSLDPGFFGFLAHVGPAWYAGLALILIAVVVWPPGREYQIAIPVLLLLLVVTLTPALVYGGPRSQSAGKHIDLVAQIRTLHRIDTSVDIYQAWPGFFAATAWLSDVTGIRDPLHLATFWPPLLGLFRLAALRYLFGQVVRSAHLAWIAVALAILADPLGADYFSPQSVGFVLALAIFALALSRDRDVPRLSLILVAGSVLAVSHQLTPYAVAGVLIVLVLFRQVRPWWTPLLVLVPALAWLTAHRATLKGFVSWADIGAWGNFRPPRTTASAGLARLPIVRETVLALVLGIVVVAALALVALLRRPHDRRLWAFACCPAAGLVLVVINPYGQEGVFRAALFGLPWLALLAVHAFPTMRRVDPGLVLAAVVAVLAWTFLVASFGLDASNVVRPADVAAYRRVQRESTERSVPSEVLSLGEGDLPSSLPPEARSYQAVRRDALKLPADFARMPPQQQLQQVTVRYVDYADRTSAGADLYALWSPASRYYDWAYGVQSPAQFVALRDAFRSSPYWAVVLHRDGTYLFRFELPPAIGEVAAS